MVCHCKIFFSKSVPGFSKVNNFSLSVLVFFVDQHYFMSIPKFFVKDWIPSTLCLPRFLQLLWQMEFQANAYWI